MESFKEPLSKNSKYYVPRHRYYELLHHCRQYADWKIEANDILMKHPEVLNVKYSNNWGNPIEEIAIKRDIYLSKINQVDRLCKESCPEADKYLLICIAGGYSYDTMEAKFGTLPISRKAFYESYRKFFWLLDKEIK